MSSQIALFDRLRAVASPWDVKEWQDKDGYYVAAARASSSDVPGLIELVHKWNDDDWLDEVVRGDMDPHDILLMPVNAWRTLADLKAEDAAKPLVEMLCSIVDFDAWAFADLPIAIGKLGDAAIEPLLHAAQDHENETQARMIAVNGLRNVVLFHPQTRGRIVASLSQFMNDVVADDVKFNANLLCALVDLRAVEAAEVIEKAFAKNLLDASVSGDWEQVRQKLRGAGPNGEAPPRAPANTNK